jgi:hypothetical protein
MTELVFITDTGGLQTIKVQDYAEETVVKFFDSATDESLSGVLRPNVRNVRQGFRLSYKATSQPDVFQSIVSNIVEDINNGVPFFNFGIDSTSTFRVTLTSEVKQKVEYANQHGLFIPALTFETTGLGVIVSVEVLDYRFVNEGVTDSQDWGLITDSVTETRDYGTITQN